MVLERRENSGGNYDPRRGRRGYTPKKKRNARRKKEGKGRRTPLGRVTFTNGERTQGRRKKIKIRPGAKKLAPLSSGLPTRRAQKREE